MKKIIILSISIGLMLAAFLISGLFFIGSGIIRQDKWELDEWRAVEILRELDHIPLVSTSADDITFRSYGELVKIGTNSLSIASWKGNQSFVYPGDLSELRKGDKIFVYYRYSNDGRIVVTQIKKILQAKDVVDFKTCQSYGGRIDWEAFPRNCVLGQVTFHETFEDLEDDCISYGGKWVGGFDECEGISRSDCHYINGDYFECESPCRNDPFADVCIAMCVQVCRFDNSDSKEPGKY